MNSESGSSPGLRDYLNTWELQQLHSWISELQAFNAELQALNSELLAACRLMVDAESVATCYETHIEALTEMKRLINEIGGER